MQYSQALKMGVEELTKADIENAKWDAQILLEYVTKAEHSYHLSHPDAEVEEEKVASYKNCIQKRADHIPLQYITGEQDFMGLTFEVSPDVLIPRADTEILVEEVLREGMDGERILDMCTGSGCILLSLLKFTNQCLGVGVDISEAALEIANKNAKKLEVEGYEFIQSDLFENVSGVFDCIVSNPPYIESDEINNLMPEVAKYEPRLALDGKNDGMWFYRRIIREVNTFLKPGGRVYFEIGYNQGEAVSRLLEDVGMKEVCIVKDYAGLDRVVKGYKPIL